MATLELRGEFLQQRLYHLSDEKVVRGCMEYFIRGGLEELYDMAHNEEQFGEYLEESSYIYHDEVFVRLEIGGKNVIKGDFETSIPSDKIVVCPSKWWYDRFMGGQDDFIIDSGAGQDETQIKCLAEFLNKDAVFLFNINDDHFDLDKLQFVEDPLGKTIYDDYSTIKWKKDPSRSFIVEGKTVFADRILYDGVLLFADEDSTPDTVKYGIGYVDKQDGSLNLNYILDETDRVKQHVFKGINQEKLNELNSANAEKMTIEEVLTHVSFKNAATGKTLLKTKDLDPVSFNAFVLDFFGLGNKWSSITGPEEYKDCLLTKEAMIYLLESFYFSDAIERICLWAYFISEGYEIKIKDRVAIEPNGIFVDSPQWFEIEFNKLGFSYIYVVETIDTM